MKIFKKLDKSRSKLDLNFEPFQWWLRSANSNISRYAGYVCYNGSVVNRANDYYNDVLPVCTI